MGWVSYGQATLKSFPGRFCKVVINKDVCGVCLVIVVRILVGISPLDTLHQFSAQLNMIFLLRWNSVLITSVIFYCGEFYLLTSWGNIGYIRLQGPRVGFLDVSIVLSISAGYKQWGVQISFSNGVCWNPIQKIHCRDLNKIALSRVILATPWSWRMFLRLDIQLVMSFRSNFSQ